MRIEYYQRLAIKEEWIETTNEMLECLKEEFMIKEEESSEQENIKISMISKTLILHICA